MKNRKKKQIGIGIVIILLVIAGISQFHVKSVKQYKEEQEILVQKDSESRDSNNFTEENIETKEPVQTEAVMVTEEETQKPVRKKDRKKSSSKGPVPSMSEVPEMEKKKKTGKETILSKTKESEKKSVPTKTEKPKSDSKSETKSITCNLVIDCSALKENMDLVEEQMQSYIPSDGMLLESTSITIEEGQSAYDILAKACKMYDIALDAEYTTLYSGYYVKGIGYLYEKQAGNMSGWFYQVNGKSPNVGASAYTLSDGDEVSWVYSCSGRVGS